MSSTLCVCAARCWSTATRMSGYFNPRIEAARRAGVRVVYARHLSLPNELAGVFQLRTAMAWQRVERVEDVR